MLSAQLPDNESQRLAALDRYHVLDTMPEESLDDLTRLAAYICQTPIALISLIDEHRQWFKSKVGISATHTPRDIAFCAHAIHESGIFEVPDALHDVRFADNPLVTMDPNVRFYAGSTLETSDGLALGTLCVIDQTPRSLTRVQREALTILSRQVMTQLELRVRLAQERQYKDYFEHLLNIIPNGMIMSDGDGTILLANTHIIKQFGYGEGELIGQKIEILLPDRFRHRHPQLRTAFLASPVSRTIGNGCELYGRRKDGSEFLVDVGLTPLTTSDGVRVLASVMDRTAQKKAEDALSQSESLNALILQSAGEGIYGLDAQGNTTFVNPAGAAMLGYTSEELLGVPMHPTMHHTKVDGSPYPREECPMYAAFKDGVIHHVDHDVLWRKDGSSFPVEYTSTPIRDDRGQLIGAVVTFRDITERQRIQEQLRLVIEAVPSGLIMINGEGAIVLANQVLESLFGYERGELLGQAIELLVPERFRDVHPEHRARAFAHPEPRILGGTRDLFGRRKDGSEFLVEVGLSPVPTATEPLMLASVVDVTARKKEESTLYQYMDDLHRSNQELDDFAYITSHDLKEPLRGIYNYSTILMEDYGHQLDEEARSRCETLLRLSKRMEDLINSLLYYSRVGRTELAIGPTDTQRILEEIIESLDIRLTECGVDIRIPRSLPTVTCDHVRIGEVFRNLITNGMKYNDKHEKWIEIGYITADEFQREASSEKHICLESSNTIRDSDDEIHFVRNEPLVFYVRDNGIGIKEKHVSSIFRIFKRLHGREQFGGGTGAGLTITKKLVERHGGKIWVESTYGEGTTFFFTLQRSVLDGGHAATAYSHR
ncbi:PAS domain S-box protein [Nitrospira sp. M1]